MSVVFQKWFVSKTSVVPWRLGIETKQENLYIKQVDRKHISTLKG